MSTENEKHDVEEMLEELKKKLDSLNVTIMSEVPREVRKVNEQYRDIIYLAGELNVYLAEW